MPTEDDQKRYAARIEIAKEEELLLQTAIDEIGEGAVEYGCFILVDKLKIEPNKNYYCARWNDGKGWQPTPPEELRTQRCVPGEIEPHRIAPVSDWQIQKAKKRIENHQAIVDGIIAQQQVMLFGDMASEPLDNAKAALQQALDELQRLEALPKTTDARVFYPFRYSSYFRHIGAPGGTYKPRTPEQMAKARDTRIRKKVKLLEQEKRTVLFRDSIDEEIQALQAKCSNSEQPVGSN